MTNIAMTPGSKVEWGVHDTPAGQLFIPDEVGERALDVLTGDGRPRGDDTEILHAHDGVIVHRDGDLAVRREFGGLGNVPPSLRWLRSNLTLAYAVQIADSETTDVLCGDGVTRTVTTPHYMGMHCTSNGDEPVRVTVMSYEGYSRKHLDEAIYDSTIRAYLTYVCLQSLEGAFPGINIEPVLDNHYRNVLCGEEDLVKLDVNGGKGFEF